MTLTYRGQKYDQQKVLALPQPARPTAFSTPSDQGYQDPSPCPWRGFFVRAHPWLSSQARMARIGNKSVTVHLSDEMEMSAMIDLAARNGA